MNACCCCCCCCLTPDLSLSLPKAYMDFYRSRPNAGVAAVWSARTHSSGFEPGGTLTGVSWGPTSATSRCWGHWIEVASRARPSCTPSPCTAPTLSRGTRCSAPDPSWVPRACFGACQSLLTCLWLQVRAAVSSLDVFWFSSVTLMREKLR